MMKYNKNIKKKILALLILWGCFFTTDYILLQYNKGPFFCIPIITHKDGGTVEYYGIGYKIIKYNVMNTESKKGRKDMVIGLWNLKYDNN